MTFRRWLGLGVLLGLATTSGCASEPAAPLTSTTTPRSAQQVRPVQVREMGRSELIFDLDVAGVAFDGDQRAKLATIRAALRSAIAPVGDAQKRLLIALSENLDAGNNQSAAIAELRRVTEVAQQSRAGIAKALNDLHAMLSPEQRKRVRGSFSRHAEGQGVDVTSWRNLPAAAIGPLPVVAKYLGTSDDELPAAVSRLQAARRAPLLATREDHARHRAIMNAFRGPAFDAVALGAGEEFVHAAHATAERSVAIVDALLPGLNPLQRARLSELLRARSGSGTDGNVGAALR